MLKNKPTEINFEKFSFIPIKFQVWMAAPVMTTKRRYVRAVTSDKQIFAVGGFDGTSHLSSVEMFHPDREKW